MKPVLQFFEDCLWKYQFEIKPEEVHDMIAWDIKQEYPGDYEPKITEIERGHRLELIFKTSEDATLFNLKYKMR